jgi:hypothetical protein
MTPFLPLLKSEEVSADMFIGGLHETTMRDLIYKIQHRINPLHVYCRLVEMGINKPISLPICRFYELFVFSWLNWLIVTSQRLRRISR